MSGVRVPAFAKINLCLDVLGKRPDGYHELRTIFQTISLRDTLSLAWKSSRGIELEICGDARLSAEPPRSNLVYRALDALSRELRIRRGIRAQLQKRIPAGRGLGGGSSDAAAALLGLLRLANREIPLDRLVEIGGNLGADIAFFLFGGRAVGAGRGNEIYPLPDAPQRSLLVVSPRGISVATPDAYAWLRRGLTKPPAAHKLVRFCALCWSPHGEALSNDFEPAVFRRHPRLGRIKRELLRRGAVDAALAGSGSAVFGIFQNPAQVRRAAHWFPDDEVFVCSTVSRREYRRALGGRAGV
ncbi:MAG: 4-(cytidine 5'-diphospho)-2-C-methyl-D-erythritol kinase [Candidatus Acidiferrales bacterium]